MIVASIRIAAASPTPICLKIMNDSTPKTEKTQTITSAALVIDTGGRLDPVRDRFLGGHAPVVGLSDPAQDEHVVVHREPEQDHEQEDREERHDASCRVEAEELLPPAVLEDEHEDPVRGRDREQVEDDRLRRDHDRAEREEQEQEREPEHEGEHERRRRTSSRR